MPLADQDLPIRVDKIDLETGNIEGQGKQQRFTTDGTRGHHPICEVSRIF